MRLHQLIRPLAGSKSVSSQQGHVIAPGCRDVSQGRADVMEAQYTSCQWSRACPCPTTCPYCWWALTLSSFVQRSYNERQLPRILPDLPHLPGRIPPYDKLLSQDPHKWKDSMPESLQAKPLASLDDAETSVPGNVYYHIARPI